MTQEKEFDKYRKRGSMHWREMTSRDIRVFNAFQRARYDWIIKIAGDVKGKKVLDLGCGDGALTCLLAKRGADVVGVDNNELGLKYARENLALKNRSNKLEYEFILAPAYELPFVDESFDLVVNSELIEHLQEPEKMLGEAARVLKKGGKFILTTPYRFTEFPQDPNHVKEYFPRELEVLLKNYFSDVVVKPTHHMMWRALYTYNFRRLGNRALWRWLLNIPILLFGWNPFMIDYNENLTKFDAFSSICARGTKR